MMQYAFSFRVVTYGQIRRKFFPNRHKSAARNRVRLLCKAGYLRPFSVEISNKVVHCVSITEKAWPVLESKWAFEVDRPHYRSESIEHDIRLAALAERFERLKLYNTFLTENLLQSSSYLASHHLYRDLVNIQSDGALALKDNDGNEFLYAVELEISRKAPERYIDKLGAYYRAGGIDGVIYICGDQEILDLVARADRNVRKDSESIVYLGTEAGVLGSQGKMIFNGINGEGIGLY